MFGPSIFGGVVSGVGDASTPTMARVVSTDDMVPVTVNRARYTAVDGQRTRFLPVDNSRAKFDAVTRHQGRFSSVPSGIKMVLPVGMASQPTAATEAVRSAYMQSALWNNHHKGIFHSPIDNVALGATLTIKHGEARQMSPADAAAFWRLFGNYMGEFVPHEAIDVLRVLPGAAGRQMSVAEFVLRAKASKRPVSIGKSQLAAILSGGDNTKATNGFMLWMHKSNQPNGAYSVIVPPPPSGMGNSPDGLGQVVGFSGFGAAPGCGGCGGFRKVR